MTTLLDDFLHRRKAQLLAPRPTFRWHQDGRLREDVTGPYLPPVDRSCTAQCFVEQDGRIVMSTNLMYLMTGDQVRLNEFAAPIPRYKLWPPFARALRVSLKRWALFK